MFYDIKFGRKKEMNPKDVAAAAAAVNSQQTNGQASINRNGNSNGNGNNTAELSIYQQYRQVFTNIISKSDDFFSVCANVLFCLG